MSQHSVFQRALGQSYEDYLSDEPDAYGIPDGMSREEYQEYVAKHRTSPGEPR